MVKTNTQRTVKERLEQTKRPNSSNITRQIQICVQAGKMARLQHQ